MSEDATQTRRFWSFPGGVHPPQHKRESTSRPVVAAPLPKRLVLPLHQHIGGPAEAIVAKGDRVLKGQKIAKARGYVSAPVHAPTSGRVIDVGDHPVPHPSGLSAPAVVIESDGDDRWGERKTVDDYASLEPSELRNIIREAGIVGLGGAGFPTYIKLNPGNKHAVETLIVNGAECEPYITCDDMLMRERPYEIVAGIRIVRHALQAREVLIAIEDNKPEATAVMRTAIADEEGMSLCSVPTLYPAGGEKQLVKVLTGKEVPSDRLCISVGVVGTNVGTAAAVYRAIVLGEPLLSRFVTVTGEAVGMPRNLEVLIGTSMHELLAFCKTDFDTLSRLVMGGPMMGIALQRTDLPVIKTTNCLLAQCEESLDHHPVMPCIRCGACADVCPIRLLPQQLYWYSRFRDLDRVQEYDLFDCIECGCCSYVCPSHIPLVQYYRYAKGDIWIKEREKEKADLARRRHDARLQRLEREKAEREARRKRKKAAIAPEAGKARRARQEEIEAAMERAKQRRQAAVGKAAEQRPPRPPRPPRPGRDDEQGDA